MRFFRRRLIPILLIAFVVFSVARVLANTTQENVEPSEPPLVITEEFKSIPHNPSTARDGEDIEQGKRGSKDGSARDRIKRNPESTKEDDVNEFAWRVFVALNWPVNCDGNISYKVPLLDETQNRIIGQDPKAPRAWELYPSPKDLFRENAAEPPSLDNLPEVEQCLGDQSGSEIEYKQDLRLMEAEELVKILDAFKEYKELASKEEELFDEYGELTKDISLTDIDAANHIPLVDQQGNYVINEIRINPVEYKQIMENKWYDAGQLALFQTPDLTKLFQLVCSDKIVVAIEESKEYCDTYEKEGAIETKALWRVFDERNSAQEKDRYYTTKRKIVSQADQALNEEVELGLIGFHIMQKTSDLGWIWSTFEHIDNAPVCNNNDNQQQNYTLYDEKKCKTGNCPKDNEPFEIKQPYLWNISKDQPKAVTTEGIVVKNQIPSQICRSESIAIRHSAQKRNQEWHKRLKDVSDSSVWQYYQLIGSQWLQNPKNAYFNQELKHREIQPQKSILANVTVEPYVQKVSCIVCHTSAQLPGDNNSCQLNADNKACADFSFLMNNAKLKK